MADVSCENVTDDVASVGCCRCKYRRLGRPNVNTLFNTVCIMVNFVMMGLCMPLLGATIVHFELLFNTDTSSMSFAFSAASIGALVGAAICGVLYDKIVVRRELSLGIINFLAAVTIAPSPFVGNLPAFIVVLVISWIPPGYTFTACPAFTLKLWGGHWLRDSFVQANYALWSLGATVGPFIVQRFLVELPTSNETITVVSNSANTTACVIDCEFTTTASQLTGNTTFISEEIDRIDVSNVRFAFVVIGSLFAVPSMLFFLSSVNSTRSKRRKEQQQQPTNEELRHDEVQPQQQANTASKLLNGSVLSDESFEEHVEHFKDNGAGSGSTRGPSNSVRKDQRKAIQKRKALHNFLYILFLVLLFLFYFHHTSVVQIFAAYLTSFAVKYAGWSVKAGTDVLAVFFASECAASFISIVASAFVPPQIVIAFDLILTASACLLLLLVDVWPSILWVSSAMAGFGIASTYGAGFLWFANIMPVTGRVSSVIVFGTESGGIIGPLIVGQLFDTVTPMSFVYVLVEAIAVQTGLFICMLAFGKLYKRVTSRGQETIDVDLVLDSADSNGVSSPVEATHQ